MKEAHISSRQRSADIGFRNAAAQIHAELKGTFRLQWKLCHGSRTLMGLVSVERTVDHVHLLLTSQPHEVHCVS
jgi:hypothetical protein